MACDCTNVLILVEEVMLTIQALKFSQHARLLQKLLDTGEAPLHYCQAQSPSEAQQDKMLDWMAAQLFPGTAAPATYGKYGQPMPTNWGSLLHPDDIYWGIDPYLDQKGEISNHL